MNRATYACARCFKQKRKCDNGSPSCSRCLQAGVECVGLDRATATPLPRSLAQYLEQRIASIETELNLNNRLEAGDSTHQHAQRVHSYVGSLTPDYHDNGRSPSPSFMNLASERLSESSEIPAIRGRVHQGHKAKSTDGSHNAMIEANSIPRNVAEMLVKVYVDKILPQYPFFFPQQVLDHFENTFRDTSSISRKPDISSFVTALVMAIATMTSKAGEIEKPMAFSDALFHGAMAVYGSFAPNCLATLQATMLVCQFANFRPSVASIWRAKDDAIRIAIALGLHRSPDPKWHTFHMETTKLRAQMFWVLYSMDRSITIPNMTPLGILDEHIDVTIPQLTDAPRVLEDSLEDLHAHRRRQQWLNHVRLRQLQSEIYAINWNTRDFSTSSYPEWMKNMDHKLHSWKNDVVRLSDSGPDWFEFVMSTVQFYLHMPCPRNPSPSHSSKLICFDAATVSVNGYLAMLRSGFLKFDWHCAHQCFCSGSFVLDNARLFFGLLPINRVTDLLDQFSETFVLLARRWPACTSLSEHFERQRILLAQAPLSAGLHQTLSHTSQDATDVMEAIHIDANAMREEIGTRPPAELLSFDDSTYWGPLDDNFQNFMNIDWTMMDYQDDFMDWAM